MTTRELSADEMKQYDRQLRLWGMASQTRMLKSRILVVGLGGMGVEICKNLVLAGVGSLTLMDHKNVQLSDLSSHFFLSESDVGKNRASSSLDGLKSLNHNVVISANQSNIADQPQSFFTQFDVVCLTDHSKAVQVSVNTACRSSSSSIKFFSLECLGWYAYFHQDLQEHEYTIKKQTEYETEVSTQHTITYAPISSIYSVGIDKINSIYGRRLQSSARLYTAIQVVHMFREKFGSLPTSADLQQCVDIKNTLCSSSGVSSDWLSDDALSEVVRVSDCVLSPVCAIFGGLIGSEILKVISGSDKPWENTVLFDAQVSQAVPKDIK